MNKDIKKVMLISGGISAEREISLISGKEVAKSLDRLGHEIINVDANLELLKKIEERMKEIVDRDVPTKREVWPRDKAISHFKKLGEFYKAKIVDNNEKLNYKITYDENLDLLFTNQLGEEIGLEIENSLIFNELEWNQLIIRNESADLNLIDLKIILINSPNIYFFLFFSSL